MLDNVLHSQTEGDIHFNLYVPGDAGSANSMQAASVGSTGIANAGQPTPLAGARNAKAAQTLSTVRVNGSETEQAPLTSDNTQPVALFVTLPSYQGLYFQGVGENLRTEDFGFEAQAYDPSMIAVAPQLSDWGETSARHARRRYLDRALLFRDTDLIKVITGVRRCGKSSLLAMVRDTIESEGDEKRTFISLNLESGSYQISTQRELYDYFRDRLSPEGKTYIFLDELQRIEGWQIANDCKG